MNILITLMAFILNFSQMCKNSSDSGSLLPNTKKSAAPGFWMLVLFVLGFIPATFAQANPEKLFNDIKSHLPHDPATAERLTHAYYAIGVETKSEQIKAKTDYLYGLIHYYKSRFYISNKYYSKALASPYAKTDLSFTESCWNNMGINYEIQNMFPESLNAYQKSLRIAEKLKDSISIGQSWINIGLLNAKSRKFATARKMTFKALDYFEKKKDSTNIALCYQNLTVIASDEKDYAQALVYSMKGLEISLALHNDYEVAGSYYNLANNYYLTNDIVRSDFYLAKALEVAPKISEREALLSKIYVQRGQNLTFAGKYEEAEKNLMLALKLVRASGASENDDAVYRTLADLYARSGDYKAYTRVMAESDKLTEQKIVRESEARVDELQALYEFQKHAGMIEDQQRDIATQKKQLSILIALIGVILSVLLVITILYIRMRRYMRSLFESKVEQTLHDSLVSETVGENVPENKQLFALYNQIIALMNDQKLKKELELSDLSRELGASEDQISQAINVFGKKDYHTFLSTYYIDNICRKMIENGKKLPLKKLVMDSPFTSYSAFNKQFKEITGLTPEQFMDYSEQKLQQEKKRSVSPHFQTI